MVRPGLAACLFALVATLLGGPLPGAPSAAAAPGDVALSVTMESLSPSVVPRRGRVTVSGVVTNRSEETWTDLQVYLLTSFEPIRSRAGLAAAAETDPRLEVGDRLAGPGEYVEIGDLAPGESTAYSLSLPARALDISGEPGAYWIGVHVLGAVDGIRDVVADGRARSFMPLMEPRGPETELALVLPFRAPVHRDMSTRLLGLERWQRTLGPGGRLRNLVDFAASSTAPLTLLVDPAVLDAAASVAADNPPLSTASDGSGPEPEEPSESPSADEEAEDEEEPTEAALDAAAWLADFTTTAAAKTVLALPYGDLDVAAAAKRARPLLRQAGELSGETMDDFEINASPVVAPPSGLLSANGFRAVEPGTPVLVSEGAFPGVSGPVASGPGATDIVLSDVAAADGGPGPNARKDPLAVRQRILSEAALHALTGAGAQPLVVTLPARWDPGTNWTRGEFFSGLDVPWLSRVDLPSIVLAAEEPPVARDPSYPRRLVGQQIPVANQAATRGLIRTGRIFAELLTLNDTVATELAKSAMLASSYAARDRAEAAADRARETRLRVRRTMQRVTVEGPPFVMMSGGTGPLAVTVVNNLDEPVTVELAAQTPTDELEIRAPEPLTLGPGQRSPVRMRADSVSIGVHPVTILLTTVDGEPIGSRTGFNVRTSNVGEVIWVIMGIGGAILLLAIVVRLVRRVRGRRSPDDTTAEAGA